MNPDGREVAARFLADTLRAMPEPLWAVVDGARGPDAQQFLKKNPSRFQTLYEGPTAALMADHAPFLLALRSSEPFVQELLDAWWGRAWLVLLHAPATFDALRRHLRRLLVAELPDGRKAHFRFFDPIVLRAYLPTCTADERRRFFGPVTRYLVEGDDATTLLEFQPIRNAEHHISLP